MKCKCTLTRTVLGAFAFVAMAFSSLSAQAEYVKLTALSAATELTGNEGCAKLFDGIPDTKWGLSTDFTAGHERWVIVKADKAFTPENYFLITGGDTQTWPERNWKDWNIYGANFESDADAVRSAEAWTLIDQQIEANVSPKNLGFTSFKLNANPELVEYDGTPYQYYMIEVVGTVAAGDTWMQMAEFGFGTPAEFEAWRDEQAQDLTAPIAYTIINGDRNNNDGEGLKSLFDGNYGTKWGNGLTQNSKGDTSNGAYFIIKSSRPVSPDYIKLVTGTDNASWNHRNWRDWELYAIEGVAEDEINRAHDGWVELASWANVSETVLPDKNSYEVFLPFEKKNDKKYRYFKVEIHAIMSGGGYMQMSEFALGDEHMAKIDKKAMVDRVVGSVDTTKPFQKSLLDELNAKLQEVESAADIAAAKEKANELQEIADKVKASITAYEEYIAAVADLANHYNNHECITGEGREIIGSYLTENVAPNEIFPNGSYVYILENCPLDAEGVKAEAKYANRMLELYATDLLEGAIDTDNLEWTALSASKMDGGEGAMSLFDHAYTSENGTKWGFGGAGWGVFKCETGQINPTYYTLCVANDTDGSRGRQWKSWKIYGANFASDEEATREAAGWVLIDEKTDIADASFPTTNFSQTTFTMTNGGGAYQYFRIEVLKNRAGNTSIGSGDYTQMGELLFYNQANFRNDRNQKAEELAGYLEAIEGTYYVGLKEEYETTVLELASASNGVEVNSAVQTLTNLQKSIQESVDKYQEYADAYEGLEDFSDFDEGTTAAWYEAYATDDVTAPTTLLRNGSHGWIMEGNLPNDKLGDEIEYIANMNRALSEAYFVDDLVYLSGYVVNQWGDGHPKHLVDGVTGVKGYDENGKPITDGENPASKLGGNIDASGRTHVIFKTLNPTLPFFYTLMTGGDTYSYQDRNWGAWDIYAANFAGDAEATEDAEGWVLIDTKNGVGKNRLRPENLTKSPFGFSSETQTPYQYYKVVVNSVFQNGKTEFVGGATQMQELTFGTEKEFEEIKGEYLAEAEEFDYSIPAQATLTQRYEEYLEKIQDAYNMEQLFRYHDVLDSLQQQITASNKQYVAFEKEVKANQEYVENTILAESEALTIFKSYLNDMVEPSEELFPNGSAEYITTEYLLADSMLVKELVFMESLKAEAIAAGYGKGADISSLIVNRTMAEKAKDHVGGGIELTGWDGVAYRTATSINEEGESMSSAEFCTGYAEKYDISQTLEGLTNGYYQVTLNAAFRPNGDINSFNYNAYAYANSTKSFIPAVREYMTKGEEGAYLDGSYSDKPIYDCDLNPELIGGDSIIVGYVVWGCEGSNNAFLNGRYAMTMVAKVTDGTLTIGLANDGTTNGGDWTCAGNFGLVYLGEEEADAADALAEATACNDARTAILEAYVPIEAPSLDYKQAPGFGAAQLAQLVALKGEATFSASEKVSEVVPAIGQAKKAYVKLMEDITAVTEKWADVAQNSAAQVAVYAATEVLNAGGYADAEAADAVGAELKESYPDILAIKEASSTVSTGLLDDCFTYEVVGAGYNPAVTFGGKDAGFGLYAGIKAAEVSKVIFTFDYTSDTELKSKFFLGAASDETQMVEMTLAAVAEPTTIEIDVTNAVKDTDWNLFKSATDQIRWQLATGSCEATVTVSKPRLVTEAKVVIKGDVNEDGVVTIQDVVAVLEAMAADKTAAELPAADVNGDEAITIQDVVAVLEIMAAQ